MPRYYEETALIEFVKQYTPTIEGETTMKCIVRAIRNAPTADVVPKSECVEYEYKFCHIVGNAKVYTKTLEDYYKTRKSIEEDAKTKLEQLQRKYDLAVAEREANVKGFTEELEKANAEIERLKYNLKAVLDEIPETKREVAREIFAEIEKLHLHVTNEFDLRRYNELKKKCTEGEQ